MAKKKTRKKTKKPAKPNPKQANITYDNLGDILFDVMLLFRIGSLESIKPTGRESAFYYNLVGGKSLRKSMPELLNQLQKLDTQFNDTSRTLYFPLETDISLLNNFGIGEYPERNINVFECELQHKDNQIIEAEPQFYATLMRVDGRDLMDGICAKISKMLPPMEYNIDISSRPKFYSFLDSLCGDTISTKPNSNKEYLELLSNAYHSRTGKDWKHYSLTISKNQKKILEADDIAEKTFNDLLSFIVKNNCSWSTFGVSQINYFTIDTDEIKLDFTELTKQDLIEISAAFGTCLAELLNYYKDNNYIMVRNDERGNLGTLYIESFAKMDLNNTQRNMIRLYHDAFFVDYFNANKEHLMKSEINEPFDLIRRVIEYVKEHEICFIGGECDLCSLLVQIMSNKGFFKVAGSPQNMLCDFTSYEDLREYINFFMHECERDVIRRKRLPLTDGQKLADDFFLILPHSPVRNASKNISKKKAPKTGIDKREEVLEILRNTDKPLTPTQMINRCKSWEDGATNENKTDLSNVIRELKQFHGYNITPRKYQLIKNS